MGTPQRRRSRWFGVLSSCALLATAWSAGAGTAAASDLSNSEQDLGSLSLDELSQIAVTSASKRPEPLGQTAASLYVITGDAIQRSGAMSIPEALRLAPNLEVSRIDALDYTISARGFSGFEAANKLLVLIDGRTVYSPLYSGVDWDQHHVLLDDVDRIEVISGPAGALWGANAVNGVVNLTTKAAFDTQGALAVVNTGLLDSDVRVRYGVPLGESAAARVYATAFKRGDLKTAAGADARDGWDGWQTGVRWDWASEGDALTLQGDLQKSKIDESIGVAAGYVRGGNVLGRWTRRLDGGGTFEAQAYFDQITREARLVHDDLRTWDFEAQYAIDLERHKVVAGGGYRLLHDEFRTLFEPQLLAPPRRKTSIGNLFVQDQIALNTDLKLTLGVKLEDNSYTRAEWMPSARLGWTVSDRQFLWAAISRAVRNPSRVERDFFIAGVVTPGRMTSESLIAYEGGYRGQIGKTAHLSISAYYDDYKDLRSNNLTAPGVLPVYVGNTLRGQVYGVEAWVDVDLRPWWRLGVGGSALKKDFETRPSDLDTSAQEAAGVDPGHWVKVRSQMQLGERVQLDMGLRFYGDVPTSMASGYVGADAYAEASVRLAWRVTDRLELSLQGDNLLHDQHPEASESRRNEIPRSALIGLRWTH